MKNRNLEWRQELLETAQRMTGLDDFDGLPASGFALLAEKLLQAGLMDEPIFEHGARRYTALAKACLEANRVGVEQMLLAGAQVESYGSESPLSALISAKSFGQYDSPMRMGRHACCLAALDAAKVDVNWRDQHGFAPAHWAAAQNSENALRWLFERGADASIASGSGVQPLHLACSAEVAELILAHGADIEAVDAAGETPLLAAIRRRNVAFADFLVERGADLFARRPTNTDDGRDDGTSVDVFDLARARLPRKEFGVLALLAKISQARLAATDKVAIAEAARSPTDGQAASLAPKRL